jgi:hypothetical protein
MLTLIAIAIIGIVIWISVATKSKDGTEIQIGSKMIHGVLLPLVAFFAGAVLVGMAEMSRGSDYGILAVPISFFVLFSIPSILTINALAMIPKWRTRQTVWLVGAIFPACLLIGGLILLVVYVR